MATLIELIDVTKEYNGQVVLRGIDLKIDENEFVTFLGPSGCGKTTTLRIIGGFLEPSAGEVLFHGKDILKLPAHKRPTNTVFQRYALFPHLNVFENIAFGLRVKGRNYELKQQIVEIKDQLKADLTLEAEKLPRKELKLAAKAKIDEIKKIIKNYELKQQIKTIKHQLKQDLSIDSENNIELSKIAKTKVQEIKKMFLSRKNHRMNINEKVDKYMKMVGLDGYGDRKVTRLSGGQQQRVAIARALINQPKVLLLDEPLAALDLKLRQEMQYELKEIQRNAGITFIFVTHDQEEALTMSDKIVVMNNGEIQQIGTPIEIYNDPINKFVASFIGESNIIPGIMIDDYQVEFDGQIYECIDRGFARNEVIDVVFRPEDIDIVERGKGKISGIVDSVIFKGVHYEVDIKTDHRIFTIHTTDLVKEGTEVDLDFAAEDIHVMEVW